MKYKLRTRLSLSYVFVALFLVALISLLTNVFLEKQFRDYIMKQQEVKNSDIVNLISQQYNDNEISWKKDLPHIFERFYRADKSRNRESGGSGVGLAIVKAIVDAHVGKMSVSSVMDEGTEFTVSFPGQII
jgi:K+-sensing histidine kinase KdpD